MPVGIASGSAALRIGATRRRPPQRYFPSGDRQRYYVVCLRRLTSTADVDADLAVAGNGYVADVELTVAGNARTKGCGEGCRGEDAEGEGDEGRKSENAHDGR